MKALILTGGKSSRMGQDKASLILDGLTLQERLVAELRQVTDEIFLSVAYDDSAKRDLTTLPDFEPSPGPLGGLQAAFSHDAEAQWLVVGCDLPLITAADFRILIEHQEPEAEVACFLNPADDHPEPLCALYQPRAAVKLAETVASQRRCARKFIASLDSVELRPSTPQSLLNLNRPELIPEARHLRAHGIHEKAIKVEYFAKLSQEAETESEELRTSAATLAGLWEEVRLRHWFSLELPHIKPAVNDEFANWDDLIEPGQTIAFMPPFAGG